MSIHELRKPNKKEAEQIKQAVKMLKKAGIWWEYEDFGRVLSFYKGNEVRPTRICYIVYADDRHADSDILDRIENEEYHKLGKKLTDAMEEVIQWIDARNGELPVEISGEGE